MGASEKTNILNQTNNQINIRMKHIFNFYDTENTGYLSENNPKALLNLVGISEKNVRYMFPNNCNFAEILPKIEQHINEVNSIILLMYKNIIVFVYLLF